MRCQYVRVDFKMGGERMPKYLTKLICGFYYQVLNIDEQILYKEIGVAVSKGISCLTVKCTDKNMFRKVCIAIRYDNPEFYYRDMKRSTINNCHIALIYRFDNLKTVLDVKKKLREQRMFIKQFCYGMGERSDEEILAYMYVYFSSKIKGIDEKLLEQEQEKWIYDIEGCLLKKSAGCLGIAQSVNYVCKHMNVFSIIIAGKAEINGSILNHVWNLVKVNGKYRHIDILKDILEENTGISRHFLLQDTEMSGYIWRKDIYPKAE